MATEKQHDWNNDDKLKCGSKEKSPCFKCEEREVGCHANCDKFKEFKEKFYSDKRFYKHTKKQNEIKELGFKYRPKRKD